MSNYTDAYLHIFEEKISKLRNRAENLKKKDQPDFKMIHMFLDEADKIEKNLMAVREAMKELRAA